MLRTESLRSTTTGWGHVLPARDEELPGQASRSTRRLLHLGHVLLQLTFRVDGIGEELGIGEDGLEQIVEIVGDPTGQLSHCLETVCLPQALLDRDLVAQGLIELGVLGFELEVEVERLVTAVGGEVEKVGDEHCGDEPTHE